MPKDWINHLDAGLLAQGRVMSERLSAAPSSYGVTAADAARLAAAQADYAAAYRRAFEPDTRTRGAVAAKRDAKAALIAVMREIARQVQADPAVTPAQKINLALPPGVRAPRQRVPAPTTRPSLVLESTLGQRLTLRLFDATETGAFRRARAADTVGADVFVFIARDRAGDAGDAAIDPPAHAGGGKAAGSWQYAGRFSGRFHLDLPAMPPGTPVSVIARWANHRGETGPLSLPVRVHIGGGGVTFGLSPVDGIDFTPVPIAA